ncbi:tRNA lysidine(34) synthetase TilS [Mycoplasma sp. Pen4]|uniref:tRNA lysidine(34) synthetase TilS n=1 Tax=Mycoplasma sp. Pen4 TaxID=640330 RepID=UPI002103AF62|nr:tRNA lysidine(34) synthetase TilS [Mycoplasma sp. Pen4]
MKYLIAVSGGPDSMFLLNKYKNKNIVVCHVNYNQRYDSHTDQKIVEEFCNKHNIPLFILNLDKNDYVQGNFQNWARIKRYDFFEKIYKQERCNTLLIAHQKDDFIETVLMQKESKRKPLYLGIAKNNTLNQMNIKRPLLFKYFKNTIIKKCRKNNIPFHIDYTNNQDKYQRNIIRHNLEKNSNFIQKNLIIWKYRILNIFSQFKIQKIKKEYKKWRKSNFSQDLFKALKNKENLIFHFINVNFNDVKLSKNKINSIIDFILSHQRTSVFKLNDNSELHKKKGLLIIKSKI